MINSLSPKFSPKKYRFYRLVLFLGHHDAK